MEEQNWFVRTRSYVGCFLSYDYSLPFIYLLAYDIRPSSMLARMPSTTIERYSALSTPLRFHPTPRRRVLSLCNGAKLRKGTDQLEQGLSDRRPTRLVQLVPASVRLPAARPCLRPC